MIGPAQNTDAWLQLKCGWIGASRMAELMAQGKGGKPSASRANLMAEKITERLTGISVPRFKSKEMERGIEKEPIAADAFSFLNDIELQTCSFIPHPTILYAGASPDRLIDADGLLEIKNPNSATHIDTLLHDTIDRAYVLQMQWQMACTGRQYCWFVSFDDRLPLHLQLWQKKIPRDERMIAELTVAVREFIDEMNDKTIALQAKYQPKQRAA